MENLKNILSLLFSGNYANFKMAAMYFDLSKGYDIKFFENYYGEALVGGSFNGDCSGIAKFAKESKISLMEDVKELYLDIFKDSKYFGGMTNVKVQTSGYNGSNVKPCVEFSSDGDYFNSNEINISFDDDSNIKTKMNVRLNEGMTGFDFEKHLAYCLLYKQEFNGDLQGYLNDKLASEQYKETWDFLMKCWELLRVLGKIDTHKVSKKLNRQKYFSILRKNKFPIRHEKFTIWGSNKVGYYEVTLKDVKVTFGIYGRRYTEDKEYKNRCEDKLFETIGKYFELDMEITPDGDGVKLNNSVK